MGFLQKVLRREPPKSTEPPITALSLLEELHQGQHRDYCLYLRPDRGTTSSADELETMIYAAFAPLPVVPIDSETSLPDESFLTLADAARVLWLVPKDDSTFLQRLALLKRNDPISRCIFLMPENGAFGPNDWPTIWTAVRNKAAELGIELSAYTAGGWLFRLDGDGKACTFRPIANPNVEKIAKALEAICEQMQ